MENLILIHIKTLRYGVPLLAPLIMMDRGQIRLREDFRMRTLIMKDDKGRN
jgi:hypothetical protein